MNITTQGVQRVLDKIDDLLTHIALDAGTTTATGLADEKYRGQLVAPYRDGSTTVREIYVSEENAVGHTSGIAILADATDTVGTGVIFGFDAVDVDKTDRDSLTISVEITVEVI